MSTPFQQPFARHYDLLYSDKDYRLECDLIEKVIDQYALQRPRTILDAGGGSGNHAIQLSQRGYQLSIVDRSEALLSRARAEAAEVGIKLNFHQADLRSFDLNQSFDLCICMFAVLSFQLTNDDIQQVLKSIHKHLVPGAIFISDVWHGPAVLMKRPENRLKIVRKDGVCLYRFAEPQLNAMEHTNEVKQHLLVVADEKRLVDEVVEKQMVRYFFPQELRFHFQVAGFEVLRLFAFPCVDKDASENDWELGIVARKC